jgi:subtilisin-like proprotein convertase family protein
VGQSCVPVTDGDAICAIPPATPAGVGSYCDYDSTCAPGLGCDFYYTCQPWCQLGDSDCTSPSGSCFGRTNAVAAGEEFGFCAEATATAASADTPAPLVDLGTLSSSITITESLSIARVTVEVDILHTFVADLRIELVAPNGTTYGLVSAGSLGGADLSGTRFDDTGLAPSNAVTPYSVAIAPETPLAGLVGSDALGLWTLQVSDEAAVDTGTLNGWRLHFW